MSTPSANVDPEQDPEQARSRRDKARKDIVTIMTHVILPLTGPSSNPVGVCPIKSRMRITKGAGGELWSCKYCCSVDFVGYSGSRVKMVSHLTGRGATGYFKGHRCGAGCLEETDMRLLLEDLSSVKAAAPVWFDKNGYEEILTFVRERASSMGEQLT